jgi:hypothetical protein
MSTRKSNGKSNGKTLVHPPRREVSHTRLLEAETTRKAAVATGAMLGAAALATAVFVMRDPIGRIADIAGAKAIALPADLLARLGIEKKRSSIWTWGAPLGTLAVGLAAGSGAMWLARRALSDTDDRYDDERGQRQGIAPNSIATPFETSTHAHEAR